MQLNKEILAFFSLVLVMLTQSFASAQGLDPGSYGSFEVASDEYDFGDLAFTPTDTDFEPVEVRASVHYPTSGAGPFPLVLFLHGQHNFCFEDGQPIGQWPCSPFQEIPSYRGYDYLAELLASHGYIAVSISANGLNAQLGSTSSSFDAGMLARASLIQHHLGLWRGFHESGGYPFGDRFVGHVDLGHIGLVGHSAGGEAAMQTYFLNEPATSGVDIGALLLLAPSHINLVDSVNGEPLHIHDVPLGLLTAYCDGDQADLKWLRIFDNARYSLPGDVAPKHIMLLLGANHNFFNTIWTPETRNPRWPLGSSDDWVESTRVANAAADPFCGTVDSTPTGALLPTRLTDAEQRAAAGAYVSAFFRVYLGGEFEFLPMLVGDAPPPLSATIDAGDVLLTYHAIDNPRFRRDVNRFTDEFNLTTNTLGGAATHVWLVEPDGGFFLCGNIVEPPPRRLCMPGVGFNQQPHTPRHIIAAEPGATQLPLRWEGAIGAYRNDLPESAGDISHYQAIQFRASVNFDDVLNQVGAAQDFSVALIDGAGRRAATRVSEHSPALLFPPGSLESWLPRSVLNTVRIPLLPAFGAIDLTDVRSVELAFDEVSTGSIFISDLAFSTATGTMPGGPFLSGGHWRSSDRFEPGWQGSDFDDSGWAFARAPYPNPTEPSERLPGTQASHMWHGPESLDGTNGPVEAFFRLGFELELPTSTIVALSGVGLAFINVDDDYEFFVNGELVFANRDNGFAGVVDRVDFTRFLRNGRNVFAIHAVDGGWDDPRDRLNESVLFDATLAPVSGLQGDFNNDRCVDRADLLDALPGFRGLQMPPVHQALDLNGDGAINIADARFLVTLFSRPRGQSCFP